MVRKKVDGKICVVTGSTQGLGAAIARRFAEAGAAGIVTLGRNRDKGAAVTEAITKQTGVAAHFVAADVGEAEDCRRVTAEAERVFGKSMCWSTPPA
jgi:NAD(P)-dependent dehydrogenase (short-subunit alcohol dehydrogenase family)